MTSTPPPQAAAAPSAAPSFLAPKSSKMFPTDILRNCCGRDVEVELKNGECFNGTCKRVDAWMNLDLVNVKKTSADGSQFWTVSEVLVRGNAIRQIRMDTAALTGPKRRDRQGADGKSKLMANFKPGAKKGATTASDGKGPDYSKKKKDFKKGGPKKDKAPRKRGRE